MIRPFIMLTALLLSSCAAHSSVPQTADTRYQQLQSAVKKSPSIKALSALRDAYAQSSFYNPYDANQRYLRTAIYDDMNNAEWQKCLRAANDLLAINYTSLPGHYGAMVCAENLGNKSTSILHSSMINGLVAAIWDSGNGQTRHSAFDVLSTDEMQVFLQMEGLTLQEQKLVRGDKAIYDLATTQAPGTGAEVKLYFNISRPWTMRGQSINVQKD